VLIQQQERQREQPMVGYWSLCGSRRDKGARRLDVGKALERCSYTGNHAKHGPLANFRSPECEFHRINDEMQPQILRLTTPKLHPKEQRPLFGDPGTEKRLGPRSLRMTARLGKLGTVKLWRELLGHHAGITL
jgi:hypothetical protein